jgi:ABC-type sugar transport system ATPase subunit
MEVTAEQVRFSRDGRTILDIGHLRFPSGATTALFGPNGSGKTTLLRLIAGLEQPSAGRIDHPPVALAFQRPVFIRGTVRENLELGLRLRRVGEDEVSGRVREAAQELGIDYLLQRPAQALSGGEAQRANLARALCLRAPVTLLDEPLAGFDRIGRARLLEELPHLLQTFATTSIIVTHDREEAFRLAAHLVVLVDGKVRAQGACGQVYRAPPDRLTAELLGYMIVPLPGGTLAVPPGGLTLSGRDASMNLVIERVVDMGNHRDAVGLINGSRVSVRIPDEGPVPQAGTTVQVGVHHGVKLHSPG